MKKLEGSKVVFSDNAVRVVRCVICDEKIAELEKGQKFGRVVTNSEMFVHEEYSPLGHGGHEYATFDVPGDRGMPGVVVQGEMSFCIGDKETVKRQMRVN